MTDKRVLVAYGTKNGATEGIAQEIAATLRKDGLEAEARPAREVASVGAYHAVILGGALYAGRWQRDARRFARRHTGQLRSRDVWFFSSGPLDDSAEKGEIPPAFGVRRAMSRTGARGHVTFGGRLAEHPTGRLARSMAKRGLDKDHRNFEQIRQWAHSVSASLLAP